MPSTLGMGALNFTDGASAVSKLSWNCGEEHPSINACFVSSQPNAGHGVDAAAVRFRSMCSQDLDCQSSGGNAISMGPAGLVGSWCPHDDDVAVSLDLAFDLPFANHLFEWACGVAPLDVTLDASPSRQGCAWRCKGNCPVSARPVARCCRRRSTSTPGSNSEPDEPVSLAYAADLTERYVPSAGAGGGLVEAAAYVVTVTASYPSGAEQGEPIEGLRITVAVQFDDGDPRDGVTLQWFEEDGYASQFLPRERIATTYKSFTSDYRGQVGLFPI